MSKKKDNHISIVITTQHRGVFYGIVPADTDLSQRTMTLENCRNAIYWAGKKGFLGLASDGPEPESRIGATAPSVLLHDITSVSKCTAEAAKVWEEWKS